MNNTGIFTLAFAIIFHPSKLFIISNILLLNSTATNIYHYKILINSQSFKRRFYSRNGRGIQSKVEIAGLEILEARITHLAYAPEIAAAMLQRQQASAIIDARKLIVEGAVGMVEMALAKLNENNIVHLDEERKAAMVSNLLVILCGNKDAQPIVNSGSLY